VPACFIQRRQRNALSSSLVISHFCLMFGPVSVDVRPSRSEVFRSASDSHTTPQPMSLSSESIRSPFRSDQPPNQTQHHAPYFFRFHTTYSFPQILRRVLTMISMVASTLRSLHGLRTFCTYCSEYSPRILHVFTMYTVS
jgi:hypothetical protein